MSRTKICPFQLCAELSRGEAAVCEQPAAVMAGVRWAASLGVRLACVWNRSAPLARSRRAGGPRRSCRRFRLKRILGFQNGLRISPLDFCTEERINVRSGVAIMQNSASDDAVCDISHLARNVRIPVNPFQPELQAEISE